MFYMSRQTNKRETAMSLAMRQAMAIQSGGRHTKAPKERLSPAYTINASKRTLAVCDMFARAAAS